MFGGNMKSDNEVKRYGAYALLHDKLSQEQKDLIDKFNKLFADDGLRIIYKETDWTGNSKSQTALEEGVYSASLGWKLSLDLNKVLPKDTARFSVPQGRIHELWAG